MLSPRSILVCVFLLFASLACDQDEGAPKPSPEEPWTFESALAPYTLDIPSHWVQEDPDRVNAYADLAINLEERFFTIVIPQKLPEIPGIETPDALALKRAGSYFFEERVQDFRVEKQGPIDIDVETGITLFAEGRDDDAHIQYIIVFVTHENWGYQIISWAPKRHEDALVTALDALLEGWSFKSTPLKSNQRPTSIDPSSSPKPQPR